MLWEVGVSRVALGVRHGAGFTTVDTDGDGVTDAAQVDWGKNTTARNVWASAMAKAAALTWTDARLPQPVKDWRFRVAPSSLNVIPQFLPMGGVMVNVGSRLGWLQLGERLHLLTGPERTFADLTAARCGCGPFPLARDYQNVGPSAQDLEIRRRQLHQEAMTELVEQGKAEAAASGGGRLLVIAAAAGLGLFLVTRILKKRRTRGSH